MSPPRRLQTVLLLWILAAILGAFVVGMITSSLTRTADLPNHPAQIVGKTVAARLDALWDEPGACEAYLARVRADTGLPLQLRRSTEGLSKQVLRAHARGQSLAIDPGEGAFIPVTHQGALVGAVQLEPGPYRTPHWSRPVASLVAALIVLGFMARRVSTQLAAPLERVAQTAERFGAGHLDARTDIADAPRRWVAEEVGGVARAFDTMAGRIEAIVRDQRELLGAISHELRSPLGRARVALEIARDRINGPTGAPQLDQIERELGSVDAILSDLLAVTRAGLSDLRRENVMLAPWLRAQLALEATPPAIELGELADASATIDSPLLGRAVHNLVDNARAHGHPIDRPLLAGLVKVGSVVRIVVRDCGPGFSSELLERAFDPFVRGDAARSPIRGGSGLGLALVRRIAEAHGGRAFARNVTENGDIVGAEVGIELPVAPEETEAPERGTS
jgi:two-component system OmpR family sensor kinase